MRAAFRAQNRFLLNYTHLYLSVPHTRPAYALISRAPPALPRLAFFDENIFFSLPEPPRLSRPNNGCMPHIVGGCNPCAHRSEKAAIETPGARVSSLCGTLGGLMDMDRNKRNFVGISGASLKKADVLSEFSTCFFYTNTPLLLSCRVYHILTLSPFYK